MFLNYVEFIIEQAKEFSGAVEMLRGARGLPPPPQCKGEDWNSLRSSAVVYDHSRKFRVNVALEKCCFL